MSDIMVVVSKVKAKVKAAELRTSADFIEELSKRVEIYVEDAIGRARVAGRKTVQAEDIA